MVARSSKSRAKPRKKARAKTSAARGSSRRRAPSRGEQAADEREPPQRAGPRPFWSGTISFGLVSVPVSLHSAVRSRHVALRMLSPDGVPLQRRYFCPDEERDVRGDELVRGYEIGPDEHVVVTDEELEALAPRASRDIDLRRFVPVGEVDPFRFETSYVLAPDGESTKAYRLLAEVMESEGRAGIATFVLRGKEHLVAILARGGVLHAETLRFAGEVRSPEDAGLPEPRSEPPPELVATFARAIEHAAKPLDPDELTDDSTAKLRALVAAKLARHADVVESPDAAAANEDPDEPAGDPTDLLAALKRSLAGPRTNGRTRKRKASPRKKTTSRRRAGSA